MHLHQFGPSPRPWVRIFQSWKKLEKVGKSWKKLGKVGKSWEKLEKVGKSWEKVGKSVHNSAKLRETAPHWVIG